MRAKQDAPGQKRKRDENHSVNKMFHGLERRKTRRHSERLVIFNAAFLHNEDKAHGRGGQEQHIGKDERNNMKIKPLTLHLTTLLYALRLWRCRSSGYLQKKNR